MLLEELAVGMEGLGDGLAEADGPGRHIQNKGGETNNQNDVPLVYQITWKLTRTR